MTEKNIQLLLMEYEKQPKIVKVRVDVYCTINYID